jgi:DNA-binding MarR family transcriptional regulator
MYSDGGPELDPAFLAQRIESLAELVDAHQLRSRSWSTLELRIVAVVRSRGPLTSIELGATAEVPPATFARAMNALETAGWIERYRDVDDRRRMMVRAAPRVQKALCGTEEAGDPSLSGALAAAIGLAVANMPNSALPAICSVLQMTAAHLASEVATIEQQLIPEVPDLAIAALALADQYPVSSP